jgi:hypothetical protein
MRVDYSTAFLKLSDENSGQIYMTFQVAALESVFYTEKWKKPINTEIEFSAIRNRTLITGSGTCVWTTELLFSSC